MIDQFQAFLYNDNCINILPEIKTGIVNLIFADPPFNLGKTYEGNIPDKTFLGWTENWVNECVRTLSPIGSFYLMTKQEYTGKMMNILENAGLHFLNLIVWHNSSIPVKNRFCVGWQPILLYVVNPDLYIFNYGSESRVSDAVIPGKKDQKGSSIRDLWDDIPFVAGGCMASKEAILIPGTRRKLHPCQMPIRLVERAIKYSSYPGGLVLDPFMGIGTTGIACKNLRRRFIGIERSKKYFQAAKERIENHSPGSI